MRHKNDNCVQCGVEFTPKRKGTLFCSQSCRQANNRVYKEEAMLSTRVPVVIRNMVASRAKAKGKSVSQYLKDCIVYILDQSSKTDNKAKPELYNPSIHRPGDKVLVKQGKKFIGVIVPEIDADGYNIPVV